MPRFTAPEHAKRWTEQASHGMSVAEIRREHKNRTGKSPDQRTVERAIKRTQAEFVERTATVAELQRGIRLHVERLITSLDPLIQAIRSTNSGQLNPHATYASHAKSVAIGKALATKTGDSWNAQIKGEESLELRLLREHLPGDKVWQRLEKFSESIARWIETRIRFSIEIEGVLTDMKFRDQNGDLSTIGQLDRAGLAIIDEAAMTARFDKSQLTGSLLESIHVDAKTEKVWIGSSVLADIHIADIDEFRSRVSSAVTSTLKADIGRDVLTVHTALGRSRSDLVEELSTLRLATFLPGACRSCKRFRL